MTSSSEMEEFTYIWKLENFSSWVQKRGERVKSPWFIAESLDGTKWRLDLYPRGIDNGNEIYISCYLCRAEMDRGKDNVTIAYEFDVIGADGVPLLIKKVDSFSFKRKESLGWPDFKSLSDIFRDKSLFLPKNVLTIRCHMWGAFSMSMMSTRYSAITEIGVGGCAFKWKIKMSTFEAPVHYFVPGPWRIELTCFFDKDECVSIKIRKFGESGYRYILLCRVSLLDAEEASCEVRNSENLIEPKQEVKIWEFPSFMKKSKLLAEKNKIIIDDLLCFNCEFSVSNVTSMEKVVESKPSPPVRTNTPTTQKADLEVLRNDLSNMYSNKVFPDVKLKVGNNIFYAHKAMLAARSSVFASMFNPCNTDTSTIDITDLTRDTLDTLLKFIYAGTLESMDHNTAMNLFSSALSYKVASLEEKCSSYLKANLSGRTVCDVLTLADEHQSEDLINSALTYMKQHTNDTLLSSEWKDLIENNVKLATETLCKLSVDIGEN